MTRVRSATISYQPGGMTNATAGHLDHENRINLGRMTLRPILKNGVRGPLWNGKPLARWGDHEVSP